MRNGGLMRTQWAVATDASRRGRVVLYTFDAVGARECMRLEASGAAPMVGFNGVAAVARQATTALTMAVGTGDDTVTDVGAAFNQTTLNNNFRDLVNKVNALRTVLVNVGASVMIVTVDARKVQVLLEVLQRAPATIAEQLICEEVAGLLVQLAQGEKPGPPAEPPRQESV